MMKRKVLSILVVLIMLFALFATANASAEGDDVYENVKPVTFKFAYIQNKELENEAHEIIASEIERLSGGAMKVERYLQGQLYTDDNDGCVQLAEGTCQMLVMGNMMTLNACPEVLGWMNIPFACQSSEQCAKFLNQVGDKVNERMLEVYNCRALWEDFELLQPRVIVANKPMLKLEDFQGVKFRLPSTAATVAAFEILGCNPLTSSWSEVYQCMQTGIAEACESPMSSFDNIAIYEVAKYCMRTNHTFSYRLVHVNEDFWQSLDEVQQEIIYKAVHKGFEYFNSKEFGSIDDLVQKWTEKGMTIYNIDEIDVDAIVEKVTPGMMEKYDGEWDPQYWDLLMECK